MLFGIRLLAIAAAALAVAAAYTKLGALAGTGLLALCCLAAVGMLWLRVVRSRGGVLRDPSISTLVFPPESKFQPSVLPPR